MSSIQHYNVMMQVVVQSAEESAALEVQKELEALGGRWSFSPVREQDSLNDCLEFMATAAVSEEERDLLIRRLNNDWDRDEKDDLYWAYGFNTRMFDPNVYYLQMEFQPVHNRS